MFPEIGIGSKFIIREESTRAEHILVLGESFSQSSEEIAASSPLGKAFLGRKINNRVTAQIEGIEGGGKFLV